MKNQVFQLLVIPLLFTFSLEKAQSQTYIFPVVGLSHAKTDWGHTDTIKVNDLVWYQNLFLGAGIERKMSKSLKLSASSYVDLYNNTQSTLAPNWRDELSTKLTFKTLRFNFSAGFELFKNFHFNTGLNHSIFFNIHLSPIIDGIYEQNVVKLTGYHLGFSYQFRKLEINIRHNGFDMFSNNATRPYLKQVKSIEFICIYKFKLLEKKKENTDDIMEY